MVRVMHFGSGFLVVVKGGGGGGVRAGGGCNSHC